jgi:predicted house-cleaning noncanonical NTP pyrophosphatase (MazG superfamily)
MSVGVRDIRGVFPRQAGSKLRQDNQPMPGLVWRLLILLLPSLLGLGGCSAISVAYNQADFLLRVYADDYVELEPDQAARWEPLVAAELARHRAEELPYLAGFIEAMILANHQGFSASYSRCLLDQLDEVYRRQARYAVKLATPFLASLTPDQIQALDRRFQEDMAEDMAEAVEETTPAGKRERVARYLETLEDWTGPLNASQEALVSDIVDRMPQSRSAFLAYREQKRAELIALLRERPGEERIQTFLDDWLVELRGLPAPLTRARGEMRPLVMELFGRLHERLDTVQRQHLDRRLQDLRDDLLQLQRQPRLASLSC